MSATAESTLFDTLTPVQVEVLKALVEGASVTAAAQKGGVHRSTVHLWTRDHPAFSRALLAARQDRAERILDELTDLSQLACDTFRQLLSDPNTPAATRLKAAMEIVKLVQSQRPTDLAKLKADHRLDRVFGDLHLAEVANTAPSPTAAAVQPPVRNAPCPCGSRLKFKRCCGNPATQTRAASPQNTKNWKTNLAILLISKENIHLGNPGNTQTNSHGKPDHTQILAPIPD